MTYRPIDTPDDKDTTITAIDDEQAITIAASLATIVAMQAIKYLPPHKKVSRDVDRMFAEIIGALKGCGKPIDPGLSDHMANCWNLATRIAQLTEYEQQGNA